LHKFIARYRSLVTGVLSGFDRLVFRGSLLPPVRDGGMFFFLERAGIRLLDFKSFVLGTSERVKAAAFAEASRLGRPVRYLESSATDKEQLARQLLAEQPVERGLICVLTAVEPCMSFEYHRSPNRDERGLRLRPRKCLHLYKYFLHPQFGFMSARLQTWFPFQVQICLNGREWLARQLRRRSRSDFKRADNCFTWLGNPEFAQRLMDEQLTTDWPQALDAIARAVNPLHETIFKSSPMQYYWSAYQTEWATDIMFKNPRTLAELYPPLVRHAMEHFKSSRRDALPRSQGARKLHRRDRHQLQGPSRGCPRQALGTRQFDQDVRQGWQPAARRDHHRANQRLQGPPSDP
jgi:hypothetical protein